MYGKLTILALILGMVSGTVLAQAPTTQPAAAAATDAPEATATAPAVPVPPPDPLVLTVGTIEIKQSDVDALLARVPVYQRSSSMGRAMSALVGKALRDEFIRLQGLKVDEVEYAAQVAESREQFEQWLQKQKKQFDKSMVEMHSRMAMEAFISSAASDEAIKKLIEEYPQFFDGTKVDVSHILIKCTLFDSTEVQVAARKRLEEVVQKIRNRELTFPGAATEFSEDTSKAKGGALGTIEFGGPMDRFFTMQTFKTEEGQMSGIFRTKDGWHIVLVTKIEAGDRTPKPWKSPRGKEMAPEDLAKGNILALIDSQIMLGGMGPAPVVNHMPKPAAPGPPGMPGMPGRPPAQ